MPIFYSRIASGKAPVISTWAWFHALYETLLGSSQGPRMGSFIALYGIDNSRRLIAEALAQLKPNDRCRPKPDTLILAHGFG